MSYSIVNQGRLYIGVYVLLMLGHFERPEKLVA